MSDIGTRRLLRRAVMSLALVSLPLAAGGFVRSRTADAAAPEAAVACPAPGQLDARHSPTNDGLWKDLTTMVGYGPRHTGHPGDHAWIDHLEREMRSMGLEGIARKEVTVDGGNWLTAPGVQTTGLKANHLWGFLPGMTDEVIVLGVHADGQNSIEENGTVTLLRAMEYLTKLPLPCRRHTFALAFVACHMASCTNSEAGGWAESNPDVMAKTVAFVSPEHMGQTVRSWFGYGPPELLKFDLWANTPALRTIAQQHIDELGIAPIGVGTSGIGTAGSWGRASGGKPVIGGMASAIPSYFGGLVDPKVGLESIDRDMFHKMSLLFTRLTVHMDSMTTDQLRN